ncbi:MAG: short chain dehydrogenase [Cyclobacteriaceae bacterium]|nr:short chain dehydrogenase [Cyclobacteriaceae bacterium]
MKIIIVGATGTIGKVVTTELSKRHTIVKAATKNSDVKVDITSIESIKEMFRQVGSFDALISATGSAHFGLFDTMTEADFYKGIKSKMMGQINLVMVGKDFITDNGSFTLTSGILHKDPIRNGVGLSFVNGALNSFVTSAAIEMKRGIRINVVSPGLVEDSYAALGAAFPGHIPVSMPRVVQGYLKSVEGFGTGQLIEIY